MITRIRDFKSRGLAHLEQHSDAFLGDLISGFFSYKGAKTAAKANTKAAETAAEAEREKLEFAKETQAKIDARTEPALNYLGRVVAQPTDRLTMGQQKAREAMLRGGLNRLNRSGLRGSGRAVSAVLKDIDSDFTNNAIQANRARSDSAASGLAGPYFSSNLSTVNTVGSALTNAANARANAGTANAQIMGDAWGSIGAQIADSIKKATAAAAGGSSYPGMDSTGWTDNAGFGVG